jgi:hypothetical protein
LNEIIITDNNEIASKKINSTLILNDINNSFTNRKNDIVVFLSEVTSGMNNIKDIIDPEKVYIAKFPKDILDKINNGQFDIMKSKSGDLLSTIIDKNAPANRNIVHQLRLEEIDPSFSQKLQNLSTNVVNIAMQKQLADLSEQLSGIQELATDIKRGQVIDRIGLVISGENQLEQALAIPDGDPMKKQLILGAIGNLNNGRSQLELYFREEMKNTIPIPKNKFQLTIKCLLKSSFYEEIEDKFNGLQESFKAYIYATNLLATAYERIGNIEVLPKVFEPAKVLMENYAAPMIPMSRIVLDGSIDIDQYWFTHPHDYIKVIENYSHQALLDDVEYISIEIMGQELLEGK